MQLAVRVATAADHAAIERLVIAAFEPITWQKKLDARFGSLNGLDWQARWHERLQKIFAMQIILLGEAGGKLAAVATATIDQPAALGFIDVLAVGPEFQGQGLGRKMLQGAMQHLKTLGCHYVNLDCLTDNDTGNALYASEGFEEVARHIRWFRRL